jgi:hypothetical protein
MSKYDAIVAGDSISNDRRFAVLFTTDERAFLQGIFANQSGIRERFATLLPPESALPPDYAKTEPHSHYGPLTPPPPNEISLFSSESGAELRKEAANELQRRFMTEPSDVMARFLLGDRNVAERPFHDPATDTAAGATDEATRLVRLAERAAVWHDAAAVYALKKVTENMPREDVQAAVASAQAAQENLPKDGSLASRIHETVETMKTDWGSRKLDEILPKSFAQQRLDERQKQPKSAFRAA